jgi:hypothetical protein
MPWKSKIGRKRQTRTQHEDHEPEKREADGLAKAGWPATLVDQLHGKIRSKDDGQPGDADDRRPAAFGPAEEHAWPMLQFADKPQQRYGQRDERRHQNQSRYIQFQWSRILGHGGLLSTMFKIRDARGPL